MMRPRRLRRAKLRTRVLIGVLLVTITALAGFDFAAVTAFRGYLLNQTDSQLQTVAGLYHPQINFTSTKVPAPTPPGRPIQRPVIVGPGLRLRSVSALDEYYVVVVSGNGSRVFLAGNPDLVPRLPGNLPALAATHRLQTVTSLNGHAQLRVQAVHVSANSIVVKGRPFAAPGAIRENSRIGPGTLVVTTDLGDVNQTVGRLERIVIIGSAIAAALVALGVGLVVRRGLRPIETMASQADRITAGDLTKRVHPPDARTEVGRLGAALNGMLTRIEATVGEREASQELARRFFADASHELRNPLASLRANAELYQQGALPQPAQVDEAMRRIALESQRMSGLVDDMLRLARLDQHPEQQRDPVDLTALTQECVERARVADPLRTWRADIAPDLATIGDEEMLRRAVDNLLANVHAHTPEGTVATITAAGGDGTVAVDVSDDGPGVPADRLPRIFDRFYRAGGQPGGPGSGLGLAIVTAVATAHQGTAVAALNDGHGLRITLTLPASQPCPASDLAGEPAS